jgi:predicted RNase H-like nuclease (RuvC/YqgF family)
MNDSVDSFMYQKHDEKGTRLDNLWNSKKDKLDITEIDPEALKFSLIKDPKKRADLYIKDKTADLRQREKIAEATSNKIFKMTDERKDLSSEVEDYQKEIEKVKEALAEFNAKTDESIIKEYDIDFSTSYGRTIYDKYAQVRGDNIQEIRENYGKAIKESIAYNQKAIQRIKGKMETIDITMRRYGIDDAENRVTVERIRKRYSEEALSYTEQIRAIEDNREEYIKEEARKIKEETKPGISVDEAVEQNTAQVSNNLYSMEKVKERIKAEKEKGMKKSLVLLFPKKIKIRARW